MIDYNNGGKAVSDAQEAGHVNEIVGLQTASKKKTAEITASAILKKGAKLMSQYCFRVKEGAQTFWWAVFSVGQRLADIYLVDDSRGTLKILLAVDGQGRNTSMQDLHKLAWKVAYAVSCLARASTAPKKACPREQILEEPKDQILGCGVEYDENLVVASKVEDQGGDGERHPVREAGYTDGVLWIGRRLLNGRVRRFADRAMCDIHDDLRANGRYRAMVICSDELAGAGVRSSPSVTSLCGLAVKRLPAGMVAATISQLERNSTREFNDLPAFTKEETEMKLHCASRKVYDTYGQM